MASLFCGALLLAQTSGPTTGSFLGVGVAEISADRARALKLSEEAGVEITRVEQGSPAEKAGLQIGDAVLEFNGQKIEGMDEFKHFVRQTPPGHRVKLLLSRAGNQKTVSATLAARRVSEARVEVKPYLGPIVSPAAGPNFSGPSPDAVPRMPLGIEIESLSPQLAAYFHVANGVLVRTVIKGSVAARAGFKAGDVVTKAAGTAVEDPMDLLAAVSGASPSQAFPVTVTRDRHELVLTVFPPPPRSPAP